jgi:hypothetical protein
VADRIIEINTKADLARFARAHESGPVNWETKPGPGGTIIITEHDEDD